MKVRYTPGTPEGLVGKTHTVEILKMKFVEAKHISMPLLKEVQIQYKDGKKEWISGYKLLDSIDMMQKAIEKRVD